MPKQKSSMKPEKIFRSVTEIIQNDSFKDTEAFMTNPPE